MSRRRIVLLVALIVIVLFGASHPGRVAIKSLLLLPNLFPGSTVRPLNWVSGTPRVETFEFDYAAGRVSVDVYHPASGGQHGAVLLVLGARSRPNDDPSVVGFADGLARAGTVVAVPESASLIAGHVLPDDAGMLVTSFQRLREMPDVDPNRVGFVGFSVGGTLSVLAAQEPRIQDQVAFVNTLGAYFDSQLFLEEIATRSIVVDGERLPWTPDDHTIEVFRLQFVEALESDVDGPLIAEAIKHPELAESLAPRLTPQVQAVLKLLRGVSAEEFPTVRDQLPKAALERLDSISPVRNWDAMHARLYVMHDVGDAYIPYTESRFLINVVKPTTLQMFTEFDIFKHVTPDKDVDVLTFAFNLVKLYRHVFVTALEFL